MAESKNKPQNKKPSKGNAIFPDLEWLKKSRDDVPRREQSESKQENPLIFLKRKSDGNEPKPAQGSGE